jgi:hypothetical protein
MDDVYPNRVTYMIRPSEASTILRKERASEDFPLPVRPT